jgi:hypothetical protein
MDLSGDGLSLSPRVRVVAMVRSSYWTRGFAESGGIWSQVGDAIAGVDANDNSVAQSLSRTMARGLLLSSYIHDGSRGHLRLFDLTGSWIQWI